MKSIYKFSRHRNSIGSFAIVGIRSTPADSFSMAWAGTIDPISQKVYLHVVNEALERVMEQHRRKGGGSAHLEVVELVETLADTKADAVRCATTASAWIALGHREEELVIEFNEEWEIGWLP